MLKDSLINTIMVATGEWLNALRRKDMVAAIKIRSEIDKLNMQLRIMNQSKR